MKDMPIEEFCAKHRACKEGMAWALARCPSGMMREAYDKLCQDNSVVARDYFDWTWPRAFDEKTLRLMAVRFVRETPLADGRKVADLLTDPRSLVCLEVAERYANGQATGEEQAEAREAARDAAWAAGAAQVAWAAQAAWAAREAAGSSAARAARAAWAAREAAWSAAARAAGSAAAGSAAAGAAREAAGSAAARAAREAAGSAAAGAAREAAGAAQRQIVLSYDNPFEEGQE